MNTKTKKQTRQERLAENLCGQIAQEQFLQIANRDKYHQWDKVIKPRMLKVKGFSRNQFQCWVMMFSKGGHMYLFVKNFETGYIEIIQEKDVWSVTDLNKTIKVYNKTYTLNTVNDIPRYS